MTHDEALTLVLDAADNWATELVEYIAPASEMFEDEESADNERTLADDIWEAIALLREEG